MSSHLLHPIRRQIPVLALIAVAAMPAEITAQGVRQTVRNVVAVSVPAVAAVREVGTPVVLARRASIVELASRVGVTSNMRYVLVAHLPVSQPGIRVRIRDARGVFQRLDAGSSVVVEGGIPGARSHSVVYRIEADHPALLRTAAPALSFETVLDLPRRGSELLTAAGGA